MLHIGFGGANYEGLYAYQVSDRRQYRQKDAWDEEKVTDSWAVLLFGQGRCSLI